jgi:toxin ParE1/3/4
MYLLIWREPAIRETQEAFEWYEEQRHGLGNEFIQELETGLAHLKEHPLHYSFINKNLRRFKIQHFPYIIV